MVGEHVFSRKRQPSFRDVLRLFGDVEGMTRILFCFVVILIVVYSQSMVTRIPKAVEQPRPSPVLSQPGMPSNNGSQ